MEELNRLLKSKENREAESQLLDEIMHSTLKFEKKMKLLERLKQENLVKTRQMVLDELLHK